MSEQRSKRKPRQQKQQRQEPDEASPFKSTTVGVYRTAATVKGGRRFSFSALCVVGDRQGQVGYGYGKASEVPPAIEKAEKYGRRDVQKIPLKEGTIPHVVWGRFGAARVKLVPASPGTGVIAGGTVRAVLELAGVRDCMTKAHGSTNQKNLVKATINALEQLRYRTEIERLRGVELGETEVDEMIKRGQAFLPPARTRAQEEADQKQQAEDQKKSSKASNGQADAKPGKKPDDAKAEASPSGAKLEDTPDAKPEAKPDAEPKAESETTPQARPSEGDASAADSEPK